MMMLVCFLLHSCFFEIAGRTLVRVSLSCRLVGLVLQPFLSVQCIFRYMGEAGRRSAGGKCCLVPTALVPLVSTLWD